MWWFWNSLVLTGHCELELVVVGVVMLLAVSRCCRDILYNDRDTEADRNRETSIGIECGKHMYKCNRGTGNSYQRLAKFQADNRP
jgi:hypothetical protein